MMPIPDFKRCRKAPFKVLLRCYIENNFSTFAFQIYTILKWAAQKFGTI